MLRSKDSSAWWKDGGGNFKVPIPKEGAARAEGPAVSDPLSRAIIALEEASAVTLMHRFNKASDLLADIMHVRALRAQQFRELAVSFSFVNLKHAHAPLQQGFRPAG